MAAVAEAVSNDNNKKNIINVLHYFYYTGTYVYTYIGVFRGAISPSSTFLGEVNFTRVFLWVRKTVLYKNSKYRWGAHGSKILQIRHCIHSSRIHR